MCASVRYICPFVCVLISYEILSRLVSANMMKRMEQKLTKSSKLCALVNSGSVSSDFIHFKNINIYPPGKRMVLVEHLVICSKTFTL